MGSKCLTFVEKWLIKCYELRTEFKTKWFSHIFLILVLIIFTCVGALVFTVVEGKIFYLP